MGVSKEVVLTDFISIFFLLSASSFILKFQKHGNRLKKNNTQIILIHRARIDKKIQRNWIIAMYGQNNINKIMWECFYKKIENRNGKNNKESTVPFSLISTTTSLKIPKTDKPS